MEQLDWGGNHRRLDTVLKEASVTDKPVIVDVPTYPYEDCYHMTRLAAATMR